MADHVIPNAEATAYPYWIICTISSTGTLALVAGVWFTREAAEQHLKARRHAYPKRAEVFCASGHRSEHYRRLCETGEVADVR